MATEIKMPQLSDTMDSGKIVAWFKNEGDVIERGDILAEVETDKANLEIESFHAGTLLKIVTSADEVAIVGEPIAILGEAGESVEASSSPEPVAKEEVIEVEEVTTPEPVAVEEHTETISETISSALHSVGDRIKASPLAKKIAAAKNIDLNTITGSGPNGRIVKKDVDSGNTNVATNTTIATSAPSAPVATAPQIQPSLNKSSTPRQTTGPVTGETIEFTKMRATIAKRMQESVTTSPHFYMTAEINMKEAKKLREALKVKDAFKGLSLNHFIIKAAAIALENEPAVNAVVKGDTIFQPNQVNIGVITAVDNGLLIPVLRETNKMNIMELANETREMISRARAGNPSSNDLSGGTFSISNMGMFDVDNFSAIINPGQGSILAVSSMMEKPVIEDGEIKPGLIMKVTLSADHRIIDGVAASQFLKYFKEALELPALLLV